MDGGGGRGAGSPGDASYNSFEPFESEEYVYDDDEYADGEIMHVSLCKSIYRRCGCSG